MLSCWPCRYFWLAATAQKTQVDELKRFRLPPALHDLKGAFNLSNRECLKGPPNVYEARVLDGIWVAAPYLHNGSVPTLNELLKPSAQRVPEFKVGPAYNNVDVGLASEQTKFNYTLKTTDCSKRNSGNSRCGHDYGTTLQPEEKKALLEYLKTL
jgi:hypothetical protein